MLWFAELVLGIFAVLAGARVAITLAKRKEPGSIKRQPGPDEMLNEPDLVNYLASQIQVTARRGGDDTQNPWKAPAPPARLLLRYKGGSGLITERVIRPKTIGGTKSRDRRVRPDTLTAFCELRQDMRTFNFERILMAANAETGEVIADLYVYLGSAQAGGSPPKLRDRRRPTRDATEGGGG